VLIFRIPPDHRLRDLAVDVADLCVTPLPRNALPPNADPPFRSSSAFRVPIEAPEGTAARPNAPGARRTSTSTVGLPRLSKIWRAWTRGPALAVPRNHPSSSDLCPTARRAAAPLSLGQREPRNRHCPVDPRDSKGRCRRPLQSVALIANCASAHVPGACKIAAGDPARSRSAERAAASSLLERTSCGAELEPGDETPGFPRQE
jgi:hypothetical protein